MKKISIILAGVLTLAGFILLSSSFKTSPPGPSANGQGTITIPGDITRHFSFHANTMPNGSVKGNGELTFTAGQLKIKFDINCMTVVGNTAFFSGVVTKWPSVPENVGVGCYFQVVDNGEGSNASPDLMSLLYFGDYPCIDLEAPMHDVEGGNIQVKN